MLDNREISIAVWIAALFLFAFAQTGVRKASVGVVKAAFAWQIVLCAAAMTAYVARIVFALREVGFWDSGNLKATILWSLTAAPVMVSRV